MFRYNQSVESNGSTRPPEPENLTMTTARLMTLSTAQLLQHDRNIAEHLDRPSVVANDANAREWLAARQAVRAALEARHVAASN
jgi:hypothetical protein